MIICKFGRRLGRLDRLGQENVGQVSQVSIGQVRWVRFKVPYLQGLLVIWEFDGGLRQVRFGFGVQVRLRYVSIGIVNILGIWWYVWIVQVVSVIFSTIQILWVNLSRVFVQVRKMQVRFVRSVQVRLVRLAQVRFVRLG